MGTEARAHVEQNFSWEVHIKKLEATLEDVKQD